MTSDVIDDALERLAPAQAFVSDWHDVLNRGGEAPPLASRPSRRTRPRKRWLLAVALGVAVLSPLGAIAAAGGTEGWWFFDSHAPAPIKHAPPLVVKTGSWDGHGWLLVAYRTENGDLCFSMNPASSPMSTGVGAAMNCGGFQSRPSGGSNRPRGITFLSGGSPELPTYVVGPVIEEAQEVVIQFAGGAVLHTVPFDAPASLGAVKFYAARLADTESPAATVEKLVGLDGDGRVVACLALGSGNSCS